MKSVTFILPNLDLGGAQNVLTRLAIECQRDFNVEVIVLTRKPKLEAPGILNLKLLDYRKVSFSFFGLLYRLIRAKPDFIITSISNCVILTLLVGQFLGAKSKFIVREALPVERSYNLNSLYVSRAVRALYKRANAVIIQSDDMRTKLLEHKLIKPSRIYMIHNICDPNYFRAQRRNLVPDADTFIFIGRLEAQKNTIDLVRAFARVYEAPMKLIIFGSGSLENLVRDEVMKLGLSDSVFFKGAVVNPFGKITKVSALLSMSKYEGFPNVFLEALACGVPIITVPISREINIMVGRSVNCRVAKSGSIEDFAEALRNWRLTARSSPRHGYERPRLPVEYLPDNVYGSLKLAFSQL